MSTPPQISVKNNYLEKSQPKALPWD